MRRLLMFSLVLATVFVVPACEPPNCDGVSVSPGTDVTSSFGAALATASANPVDGLVGPSGEPQGRVYLGPGEYRFRSIVVPDDVRVEIAPGATLRSVSGYEPNARSDWGLLVFGSATDPTRNVTFTSGDGCGGVGAPTRSNKPTNTGFRGNDPANGGMANAPVPSSARWNTDAMWVMDLDPKATGAGEQITGFYFRWSYDVAIANVLTIQNASRTSSGIGPVANATSRTVAMMFDPPNDTNYTPVVEDQKLPHRVTVVNHYNILSPSGQGANQIRACRDCTFAAIYSHGGVPLRVETDGIRPVGTDCAATGPNGVGFREFAIVDGLRAQRIEGAYGNRVAMFTPHCLPNGTAEVTDLRGTSMGELLVVADHQSDGPNGGFESITVRDIVGCGGSAAQDPHPDQDSYLLAPSRAAVLVAPATPTLPVTLAGTLTWPSPPSTGGLIDGLLPAGHSATITHPTACP